MAKTRKVALAFPMAHAHLAQVTAGIKDYAQQHGDWRLAVAPETLGMSLSSLRGWPGDGVISLVNRRSEARAAKRLSVPVVNISGAIADAELPCVTDEHRTIGHMAADHLLECGFRRFAYYGLRGVLYAQERGRGFVDRVQQHGGTCAVLEAPSSLTRAWPWQHWAEPLEQWLRTLEPPVGLMAALDMRATIVVDACHRIGLRVPDDVAVIGVNNSTLICELSHPPVSSVARDGYEIGRLAAVMLDRLMAGKRPKRREIHVPPLRAVKRGSTDVLAIEDPDVATVVRFVREHVGERFGVEMLARLVPVSRRRLEQRFKRALGRTPHEFICRTRVEQARQMLTDPARPRLYQIAAACGFRDTMRFRIVFQRLTGTTPAAYRAARLARP